MRQLININLEPLVKCDNTRCDYKVKAEGPVNLENFKPYLNKECTDCGENLLTEDDLNRFARLLRTIEKINTWFSWLTLFSRKSDKTVSYKVGTHKKLTVEKK